MDTLESAVAALTAKVSMLKDSMDFLPVIRDHIIEIQASLKAIGVRFDSADRLYTARLTAHHERLDLHHDRISALESMKSAFRGEDGRPSFASLQDANIQHRGFRGLFHYIGWICGMGVAAVFGWFLNGGHGH
jgi:hypothetical protein